MRCLLLGKNGQLGSAFSEILPRHFETIAMDQDELDLTDLEKLRGAIQTIKPNFLVNAAAYTAVDRAEKEFDIATQVNALAPRIMAEEMETLQGGLIHFSTDYVFDGRSQAANREVDIPSPVNVYGASKLYGEHLIQQSQSHFLIFRTSWVYAPKFDNFVTKVIRWARKNPELKIVTDQIGNPTSAQMLARLITSILVANQDYLLSFLSNTRGIYHCAGKGAVSRYSFAKEIVDILSQKTEVLVNVSPVTSDQFPTVAKRPLNSSLNLDLFETKFEMSIPTWQESLLIELQDIKL